MAFCNMSVSQLIKLPFTGGIVFFITNNSMIQILVVGFLSEIIYKKIFCDTWISNQQGEEGLFNKL